MSKVTAVVISFSYVLFVQFSFGQFHPVPEMEVDLSFLSDKEFKKQIKSFNISELITVKEFKEYLVSVKKILLLYFINHNYPNLNNSVSPLFWRY